MLTTAGGFLFMTHGHYNFRRALRLTALYSIAVLAFAPSLVLAFNPNPENTGAPTPQKPTHARAATNAADPLQRIAFPANGAARQVPVENQVYTAPSAAAASTSSPAATLPAAPTPHYPPVDAAVAKQAEAVASSLPAATIDSTQTARSYVAPTPLNASASGDVPTPSALPEPIGAQPDISSLPKIPFPPLASSAPAPSSADPATAPQAVVEPMSASSKKILSSIPSKLDTTQKSKGGKMNISRMSPELKSLVDSTQKAESFDAVGLSIKVQRPGLDSNYELNRAYTALMGGDTSGAIAIYKNILSAEPEDQDALFGIAATYHRVGELEKARPYYGRLLKLNPHHREGLNNFLSLISDESPQEALAELERLEQRNPDFSPIPAQQAVLLDKMGFYDQAREKMLRAMELAPENITYKYNLAVMLDRQGRYADAGDLYRLLINASLKGQKIPASAESLQKRLNFISTAVRPTSTIGG
jgi:Flp pilus assembly protein TadD